MSRDDEGVTPLLELRRAAFGYRRAAVLRGIDLAVGPGQFLAIAGPNGGGKTTLFRGILGLIPPLEGDVRLGTDAVGYVPQRDRLDPIYPLTVAEVAHMGAYGRLSGLRLLRREERELASACLARVGLAGRERERFSALSGGQRQRALVARALMARPRLCLLDEPTSGVDAENAARILALLSELVREEGLSVLLVTHQLGPLRGLADGLLWVEGGQVERRPVELLPLEQRPGEEGAVPAERAP